MTIEKNAKQSGDLCCMGGIYIHIPFCAQACTYCNFHFSTQIQHRGAMVDALVKEIKQSAGIFTDFKPSTVYFGGGTPSLLTNEQVTKLMTTLKTVYSFENIREITFECNPEDATPIKLNHWKSLGINRLSIGLQSLQDLELKEMNRVHNRLTSLVAVENALAAGFTNFNVDFIYGTPWKSHEQWIDELDWAFSKNITHISAYALTVEPKTVLDYQTRKGIFNPVADNFMGEQFEILQNKMQENSWDAYEISNYCKPGHRALHNGNYWEGLPYLGIGPSAHGYDGISKRWSNIANNAEYMRCLENGQAHTAFEELSDENRFNEYIMTALRTSEGIKMSKLKPFNEKWWLKSAGKREKMIETGLILQQNDRIWLTNYGKLISDYIISELMV